MRRVKPKADPYGYDQHEIMRSYLLPTGVALVLGGFAARAFLTLLPASQSADDQVIADGLDKLVSLISKDLVDMSFSETHIAASLALMACIIVALVIARYAHEDNEGYRDAYPYIEDIYSPEDKAAARKTGRAFVLGSLGFFVVGAVLMVVDAAGVAPILHGFGFLGLATGVWLLLHGLLLWRRTDVFAYNYRALDGISIYELQADAELPARDVRLAEKRMRAPMQSVKRAVITAGFLMALALYALPSVETPFYWMAIVVAFIVSGALGKYSEEKVKKLAQSMGDGQEPSGEDAC